jgi:hypothetical protein
MADSGACANQDNQPLWTAQLHFKDPSFGPPLTVSSNETPASLRAIRAHQDAVAKAIPIVLPPDADYQECLAIALEMERDAVLVQSVASLTLTPHSTQKEIPKESPKKKRKIVLPPPPPPQ